MISIVIPVRNERFLEKTINNIKKNQDNINEIILIFDEDNPDFYYIDYPEDKLKIFVNNPRKGTSVSRDIGAMNATYDCIVQIDSHILFSEKGFDTFFLEQHKKNINNILCCKMLEVDCLFRPYEEIQNLYQGAEFVLKHSSSKKNYVAFSMKWITEEKLNNEVPLVMGACYIFSKERYINVLKRPLSIGCGWGKDEQRLSISNWLCGGTSKVIDYVIYHNTNSMKFKKEYNCENKWDYNYNALSAIKLFPMKEKLREELILYVKKNYKNLDEYEEFNDLIEIIDSNKKLIDIKKYYESLDKTLEDYLNYFNINVNDADSNIKYEDSQTLRRSYNEPRFKNSYFYKKKEVIDLEYSITSLHRSGSYIITNWIYSQLDGNVNYIGSINNPKYRVDYRNVLKKAKWENNLNYNPVNTTNKNILLYNLHHVDLENFKKNPFLSFTDSTSKKSILIIRSPENYIASASVHIDQGLMMTSSEQEEIEVWKDYALKCIKYKEKYSCLIYFDKFITDESYRNYLFNILDLKNKNEKCLDMCPYYGGGSSFDKNKYINGNASEMDILNRWKIFEDKFWMQEIMLREDISEIKKELINICDYEKNIC